MTPKDFDRAFRETPDCVRAGIQRGFERGRRADRTRGRRNALLTAAAALLLLAGAALLGLNHLNAPRPDLLPLAQSSATPTPAPSAAPEGETFYATAGGSYYHRDPDCSGMQGASPVTEAEASALNKQPCPICVAETFYATVGGNYYHRDPDCSGMQGASPMTEAQAEALSKLPCPVCAAEAE